MRSFSHLLGTALAVVLVAPAFAEPTPDSASAEASAAVEPLAVESEIPESAPTDAELMATVEEPVEAVVETAATAEAEPAEAEPDGSGIEPGLEPEMESGIESGDEAPAETAEVAPEKTTTSRGVAVGPVGVDSAGREGRIHTVARGDTLWDISASYLGTPWVWPSVWHENDEIENPHRIQPGDLIWISSTEMRRVTRQEADDMIAAVEATPASGETELADAPAAFGDEDWMVDDSEPEVVQIEMPVDDQMPVTVPLQSGALDEMGRTIRVSSREGMSFVSADMLAAASSIVGTPLERLYIASSGDLVHLGLGEGEVEVGEQFTVFHDAEEIRDVDNSLLGYHVEVLGWLEVDEVHGETSTASVRLSVGEMVVGDHIVPRESPPVEVAVREAPSDLYGAIIHLPDARTLMAMVDYVYVNRGSIHGVEVGSALEVFDPGVIAPDLPRHKTVQTPNIPVAQLVAVSVKAESCVAYVTGSRREIAVGDVVRSALGPVAAAR